MAYEKAGAFCAENYTLKYQSISIKNHSLDTAITCKVFAFSVAWFNSGRLLSNDMNVGYLKLLIASFAFVFSYSAAQDAEQSYTPLLKKDGANWIAANYSDEELNQPGMLCIRFNNYWCIKSPKGKPTYWNGQVDQDDRGHAEFSHPKFAARAFVKLMRTYYIVYGLKSASQIMNRYAPPTDTIGSIVGGARNPTEEYAKQIARLLGKTAHEDLELFNPDNSINKDNMVALLQALAKWEITAKHLITKELALDGIALSGL